MVIGFHFILSDLCVLLLDVSMWKKNFSINLCIFSFIINSYIASTIVCVPLNWLSWDFFGVPQGFTYPVRSHFLENILEVTGYRLTPYNQIDNYGQDKMWKMQKQQAFRKRKTQIASAVEVFSFKVVLCFLILLVVILLV